MLTGHLLFFNIIVTNLQNKSVKVQYRKVDMCNNYSKGHYILCGIYIHILLDSEGYLITSLHIMYIKIIQFIHTCVHGWINFDKHFRLVEIWTKSRRGWLVWQQNIVKHRLKKWIYSYYRFPVMNSQLSVIHFNTVFVGSIPETAPARTSQTRVIVVCLK